MDATLCRTCGKRHWGICAGRIADAFKPVYSRENIVHAAKVTAEILKDAGVPEPDYQIEPVSGFAPAGQCPYCDAMRVKNQARAKKHRSKV